MTRRDKVRKIGHNVLLWIWIPILLVLIGAGWVLGFIVLFICIGFRAGWKNRDLTFSVDQRPKFTVEEIREYIEGDLLLDGNGKELETFGNQVIRVLAHHLEDEEDGIAAVMKRKAEREEVDNATNPA